MKKNLNELLSKLSCIAVTGNRDQKVTGVHYDSRSVEPGGAFVAIHGHYSDGHKFIPQAVKNGAGVVFGEFPPLEIEGSPEAYVQVEDSRRLLAKISHLFFGKPTEKLFVVGITGTNGKTTTAHLASLVLGKNTDLVTTLTHAGSLPEKEPVTTPESPEIQDIARTDLNKGIDNLVLEVSSHGLSLNRVDYVDFDCGVFTNLTRDHLDFYETMEEYANEKIKLFSRLSKEDHAIVNADEKLTNRIVQKTRGKVLKYGIEKTSDVLAEGISKKKNRTSFQLKSPWGTATVDLNLPGIYNVYNALAAASVGLIKGVGLASVVNGLRSADRLSGRLEKVELKNGADVYVDFAHNPGALKETLMELRDHYKKVLLVFGCGGMSDRGKRPEMGKIATKYADRFFITDDNPKGENRNRIMEEIERGVRKGADYEVIPQRKSAIERAMKELTSGSCLLVAGKGHETHQIVSDKWIEYNDRDFVERLAREKSLI